MKSLIVNADDFGLSSGICRGIIRCHRQGIVTSTSVMAVGAAFDEGVELLLGASTLATGVHLTLVGEKPVLPPQQIPTLVGPDGRFLGRWQLLRRLVQGRVRFDEVRREWAAQVRKCLEAELSVTHLDSDDHLHIVPSLWRIAVELCREHSIPSLRRPNESILYAPNGFFSLGTLKKMGIVSMVAFCPKDIAFRSDHCVGLSDSGHLNEKTLVYHLTHLREGTTELVCHPGFADETTSTRYSHWRFDWEGEVRALTAKDLKTRLKDRDITLATPSTIRAAQCV